MCILDLRNNILVRQTRRDSVTFKNNVYCTWHGALTNCVANSLILSLLHLLCVPLTDAQSV